MSLLFKASDFSTNPACLDWGFFSLIICDNEKKVTLGTQELRTLYSDPTLNTHVHLW